MNSLAPKDWLSFIVGFAGLTLGIINLTRSIILEAHKISVHQTPDSHFPEAGTDRPTILRIANHRNRPVTIVDAGFLARERNDRLSVVDHGAKTEPKFPFTVPAGGVVDVVCLGEGAVSLQ